MRWGQWKREKGVLLIRLAPQKTAQRALQTPDLDSLERAPTYRGRHRLITGQQKREKNEISKRNIRGYFSKTDKSSV